MIDKKTEISTPELNLFRTGNAKLHELARVTIESAQREFNQYRNPVKRYHSFMYKAESWKNYQRVIVKVEVSSMGTNIRYIVTDLHSMTYILIHTLYKQVLKGTEYANATMKTIQLKTSNTVAWDKEMRTRIKIELPHFSDFPSYAGFI